MRRFSLEWSLLKLLSVHLDRSPLIASRVPVHFLKCSGLRSLMALGTLAVVFAYFFRKNMVERVVIIASAIPIAILVNAFRVALTGWLTHSFGPDAAEGMIHTTEGFFTFGLAFAALLLEAWLIQNYWPWKSQPKAKQVASA